MEIYIAPYDGNVNIVAKSFEKEEQYADEIARYESICGSSEDDYYARCCDAWQEGEII